MNSIAKITLAVCALSLLAGCASTSDSQMFMSHFNHAAQNEEHSKCMNENAMFNNRQLMVAPSAVQNAWTRCLNQFGTIVPGQEKDETLNFKWGEK